MRALVGSARYWGPLLAGFLCLVVARYVGPLLALALFFVAFGLILDGATAMFARAVRAGGLGSHRQ
ncbi:MAG: hypothetical protein QOI64_1635 [Solirubrobacteraceae bacterium]|jgi:hypothetical protein|nr:hypothetical protein [Solirubrobacteraceae bacterium]